MAAGLGTASAFGPDIHWVTPTFGLAFTVGLPAVMIGRKLRYPGPTSPHRVVFCVVLTVLLLMVLGLVLTTVGPMFGDSRPLATSAVFATVLLENVILIAWRAGQNPALRRPVLQLEPGTATPWALLGLSLALCVTGVNRLNNGASGSVALSAMGVLLVALTLVWIRRERFTDGQLAGAFFIAALVVLLGTSLRGWYITGHDIQREYHAFQLTNSASRWDISAFRDPYNACMSITVLPTMLVRMLRVDGPYIFKVFLQAFFALSASTVYLISRRLLSRTGAFLACCFFVGFPTFFTDMPFIIRQETTLTFASVALLIVIDDDIRLATRRVWLLVLGAGVALSHYSTMYFFVVTLILGYACRLAAQALTHSRRRRPLAAMASVPMKFGRPVAGIGVIAVLAAITLAWTFPLTHTGTELGQTANQTVGTLLGDQPSSRSSDLSYSLLHGQVLSPSQELAQYRTHTLNERSAGTTYLPTGLVNEYDTPPVVQVESPETTVGTWLSKIGLSSRVVNADVRGALAKYYQLGAALGLALMVMRLRRRRPQHRRPARIERPRPTISLPARTEFACLAAGAVVGVAIIVALPDLSVQYGVLRAFQQALILLAPLLAEATLTLAALVFGGWARGVAVGATIAALASLIGAIPQLVGGYAPQLSLNDSGTYYNDYYLHPGEVDAMAWMSAQLQNKSAVQAEVETDRYTYYLIGKTRAKTANDIFPTLIEKHAFVFVGYSTVTLDEASVSADGNTVSYRYPTALLTKTKDLIFSSHGARIYR